MLSRAANIILGAVIVTAIVGGGVYVWQQRSGATPATQNGGTYQNKNLGISFQYPTRLGKIWERYNDGMDHFYDSSDHYYNASGLSAVKFLDEKNEAIDLGLYPGGEDYAMRTCDDILKNGFNSGDLMPSACETLTVDTRPVRIVTFTAGGLSNSAHGDSKFAMFQTNGGVWIFSAGDKKFYSNLLNIVTTIQFF